MRPPNPLQPEQTRSSIPPINWEPILRLKGFSRHTYGGGSDAGVPGWSGWVECHGALFGFILDDGSFLPFAVPDLTSDHLFGFVGWLTKGVKEIAVGSLHDAVPIMDELKRYMEANGIGDPSAGYPDTFKMPSTEYQLVADGSPAAADER